MIITDAGREELQQMFTEENCSSIRIFFSGYG